MLECCIFSARAELLGIWEELFYTEGKELFFTHSHSQVVPGFTHYHTRMGAGVQGG